MIARALGSLQRVERSTVDETFQNSFVNRTFFNPLRKIEKRLKGPSVTRPHDCSNAIEPNSLDRRQTVTDRALKRGETYVAFVNIGRQKNDSLAAHFFGIAKDLRSVIDFI